MLSNSLLDWALILSLQMQAPDTNNLIILLYLGRCCNRDGHGAPCNGDRHGSSGVQAEEHDGLVAGSSKSSPQLHHSGTDDVIKL